MTVNLSHSQLNGWASCGERHRLERIVKVPSIPAWNLVGGSAVHETTEARDLTRHGVDPGHKSTRFEDNFDRLTADAEDTNGIPRDNFRASGRASKAWPNKENRDWWLTEGPHMVDRWDTFITNAPYDLWVAPDGTPGVEIGFELPLDPDGNGEPRVNLRGYIDRVLVNRHTGGVEVWDIKTGASKQFSSRQLGTYRVGLRHAHGVDALRGAFWDARGGTAQPADLNEYTVERLTWQYQKVRQARELGVFIPNPGPLCSSCSVAPYCYEQTPEATTLVEPPWGWGAGAGASNVGE